MKTKLFLLLILVAFIACEKEEDYRKPYTGLFNYTTIKRTVVMCYDNSPECIDGWKTLSSDTIYYSSSVKEYDIDKLKIKFGDGIIGIADKDSTITQTIYPIISSEGVLTLSDYPIGGHNKFDGKFFGYDTIKINLQFGYQIGGYDGYEIIGIRDN